MVLQFEDIEDNITGTQHRRARVPGGWLYEAKTASNHISITYVPDVVEPTERRKPGRPPKNGETKMVITNERSGK